jgi:predicted dehydrogenase
MPSIVEAEHAEFLAVASRSLEKARATAEKFGVPRVYGSYKELLEDPDIEAVYIPLPNSLHKPWSIAAVNAGKHVLCEKPIALNAAEARDMQAAAEENARLLLEAFMYRFSPIVQKAIQIIRDGTLGELRAIHSVFNFYLKDNPKNVRLQPDLGGGALYDAGCYCINVQRMLTGREPHSAWARLSWSPKYHVDMGGVGVLDFGDGLRGTFFTGMHTLWDSYFRVSGTKGTLEAPAGFLGREREAVLRLATDRRPDSTAGKPVEPYIVEGSWSKQIVLEPANPYVLQMEDACAAIRGQRPAIFGDEPLDANMRVIDAIYASDKTGDEIAV